MGADAARQSFAQISSGEEQLDREKKRQHAERDDVSAPGVSVQAP